MPTTTPPRDERALAASPRGSNQVGVRLYNERLVLSLIRRHGSLPKAEIARMTGLSAQTVSLIVKQLETDGFLRKEKKVRGRVGQPSVPFSIKEDGASAFGLKIGRRSAELVAINMTGQVAQSRRIAYHYPEPQQILEFTRESQADIASALPKTWQDRVSGMGIAMPSKIWLWEDDIHAPQGSLAVWRDTDIGEEMRQLFGWPIHVCNDATAACAAELIFGAGHQFSDFIYLYVGAFIGGGVVLNGQLVMGRTGNAGAFGPLLVTNGCQPVQLIRAASIFVLEERFQADGQDASMLWTKPEAWPERPDLIEPWILESAASVAQAVISACAVLDVEAVVIDGAMPASIRDRFVAEIPNAMRELPGVGIDSPEIVAGSIGPMARSLGGASLPLIASFSPDREVLFKDAS